MEFLFVTTWWTWQPIREHEYQSEGILTNKRKWWPMKYLDVIASVGLPMSVCHSHFFESDGISACNMRRCVIWWPMRWNDDQSKGMRTNKRAWWPIKGHNDQSNGMKTNQRAWWIYLIKDFFLDSSFWIMSLLSGSIDHFDPVFIINFLFFDILSSIFKSLMSLYFLFMIII